MQDDEQLPAISAESIRERLRETPLPDHAHAGPHETVREATYRGHHIVVRTTYAIEVDGRPVEGHLGVTDDGRVHYHPVPNLAFPSAIDMVKQLIDVFPDDFAPGALPDEPHDHEGHSHGGDMQHEHGATTDEHSGHEHADHDATEHHEHGA
jgi:hypothetical protein